MMLQERSEVWCRFRFLISICSILGIQCTVFLVMKGNLTPLIISGDFEGAPGYPPFCYRYPSADICYVLLRNHGWFNARFRAEYAKDGRVKYSHVCRLGCETATIEFIAVSGRVLEGLTVCIEAQTIFGSWLTVNCSVISSGGNFRVPIVYTIVDGVLLFETLFFLSMVVDILIIVAAYIACKCVISVPGVLSIMISTIDFIVNAVHPDRIRGSVFLLLSISIVRFIWFLAVWIYDYHVYRKMERAMGQLIPLDEAEQAA
jgi:hypothetical protein